MAPWAYVLDDLTQTLKKTQENGGLCPCADPLSMHEITAMADYNLARSRNLFGSLKNAYDQRAANPRQVPMHMMPDFMTWLRTARPETADFLYGPAPRPRVADTRTRSERRVSRGVVQAERVEAPVKMPPVDEQGRIRHHHTYEQPEEHSYRVQAGGLNERRQHQIPVRQPVDTEDRTLRQRQMAQLAADAAEKRNRPRRRLSVM